MLASSDNSARALWGPLVDLTLLVGAITLGMMALLAAIALRIARLLVATAAGFAALASVLITVAWACGVTKPINLLFWLYAAGLLILYGGLLLLREKVAELPAWVIRRRDYARQLTELDRIDGLHSRARSRDL